ncbi:vacuolar segregation subunit 7-domain-containing protein [Microdochium trichocladiopsis]|uniref:Vacuolar segregation subunit 7-domain-containing protein n=1 Tax=Microdochium trichocladiopsis TaxID=1682393 RepID=A0A9P8XYL4_9PEZI|nr:vacuolar segregation subunit 7-domain-containing protein [Microdochium trichocladiopsis]KAH7026085.1 vacuolar segregation subunit 7-domain-containing protein [Microdochium trichocladiopsis]
MAASATAPGLDASISSLNSADNDNSATSSANIDTQQSKWTSANTSVTASPHASREASPTRPAPKTTRHNRTATGGASRSRQNSLQEPSPSRARSAVPPAPMRSSISASSTPALPPPSTTGPIIRAPIPQKPSLVTETSRDSPRWPVSPRLKSPPPALNRPPPNLPASRKNEVEPPAAALAVRRASPTPQLDPAPSDTESEDTLGPPGVRTPSRGPSNGSSTLETVQEVSQPNTPGPGTSLNSALEVLARSAEVLEASSSQQSTQNAESGSDSGDQRAAKRRSVSAAPPLLHSRQSSTALKVGAKGQAGEGSGHMTVEEEKVTGLPQMSLKPSERAQGSNGSLRAKPSTETIRPRKEKKKNLRKPAPVVAGTVSSKADIFEAKVASAVEENDSSDSDETFVYDSNPPDVTDRPRRYHHSRTPSATSMASQADRNGLRSLHSMMDSNSTNIAPKKNMKFVNTFTGSGTDSPLLLDDDGRGTRSSNAGSARGTSRHHHHVGRWLRNSGNHTSLFDNESPFPATSRTKFSTSVPRQSTLTANSNGNTASTSSTAARGWAAQSKRLPRVGSIYNMDDTPGADDEHTPLLLSGTVRSARSRGNRRNHGAGRNIESQTYRQRPSFLNRFASCLVLTIMLLLVITGAIGFMFATSQPLMDLEIIKIENVLASEQELMMDIQVRAHNPNVVVVMVDSANLEVFAKSPHAGKDSEWWRDPHDTLGADDMKSTGGKVKPPAQPPSDETDPNMRLGNIHRFDSPLTFEGSFFRSGISTSSGELRLARPGNTTERGSERWERILEHNFTLIIQGTLNYQLPLSSKQRSVIVSGSARVLPNSADQPAPTPNGTDIGLYR